jgi:hypothetical protein
MTGYILYAFWNYHYGATNSGYQLRHDTKYRSQNAQHFLFSRIRMVGVNVILHLPY